MKSADIMFLDTSYGTCKIIGNVCTGGDCRMCSIPIVMPQRAKEIVENEY